MTDRVRQNASDAGFTLAEVLAAMFFMAIVLPVICEAMAMATRASVMAERSREAAQLADRKLNEMIVTSEWEDGEQSGDFDSEYAGYSWKLTTTTWSEDSMTVVTVQVFFMVQGQESSVSLSTLVPESEEESS